MLNAETDFRRVPVTVSFAVLIVALELVCQMDPQRRLYYYNDLKLGISLSVWQGEIWRPLTTTLLHGNLLHAGFNIFGLWFFGRVLEERLGPLRYLGFVVLLAYVSMMPEFLWINYDARPQVAIVGFSGVVYGLFGMTWVGRRRHADLAAVCTDDLVRVMLGWLIVCVGLTWAKLYPVANVAHASGLAFGALYGMALFGGEGRWRFVLSSVLATAAVLSTLLGFPGHRGYEAVRHYRQFERVLRDLQAVPLESPQSPREK